MTHDENDDTVYVENGYDIWREMRRSLRRSAWLGLFIAIGYFIALGMILWGLYGLLFE